MATETQDAAQTAADAAHGANGAAGAEAATGMPQLDPSSYGNQILWLVVTLVVIYYILSRIALPRIAAIMAERQGTITNDLAAAEDLKANAAEAEEAYKTALADARAEAQGIIARTKDEMKQELDTAIAEADKQIAAKAAEGEKQIAEIRANALESVEQVSREVAAELVATLGGKADDKAIADAVDARLKG